ncbi:MAG TPA: tape measure protein, partial [Lacipirellula sp.]
MSAIRSLGDAMVDAGVSALKLAAEFETAEITFTTLFKSASAAKQVMAEIKQFAATTPFEFPQLKDAGAKLAGFGISAKQVVPTLKMLGDIAAGTGTSINELAETYGKARITGRAYTRDVMELANRNVPIWEALNKVLGTTNAETHKLVEDGKVGFRELQQAILSLVQDGGQFQGAMEDRAKGIEGLVSNLKDNITIAFGDLGEAMIRELNLKEVASQLIDLTGVFQTDGIPVLIEFGKGLTILGTAGNETLKMLTGMDLSIKGITETIYGAHAAILQWQLANAKLFGSQEQVLEIQKQIVDLAVRAAGLKGGAAPPGAVELEPGGNQTGIDKEIAALELQAQMVGKSATEKKLAELATKGLLEADMEYVAALLEQTEAQQAAIAAEEQTRKTMESHIAALKLQADTFNMTSREVDLYKAKLAGATAEELKAIEAQHERIRQQQDAMKEGDELSKKSSEATAEIGRITERNLTPLEKFNRDMERLNELKHRGLNDEQFGREAARLKQELEDSTRPQRRERNTSNPALVAGTSQFYSAISRSLGGNANDPAQQTRKQA